MAIYHRGEGINAEDTVRSGFSNESHRPPEYIRIQYTHTLHTYIIHNSNRNKERKK